MKPNHHNLSRARSTVNLTLGHLIPYHPLLLRTELVDDTVPVLGERAI